MTQPTERRFVMEPRLDAEIETINNALDTKITNPAQEANIADGAVTSAKIANGTIVNADVNASAAIDKTKISGTAITAADTGTVTGTILADNSVTSAKIVNGTIVDADVNASAAIAATKVQGTVPAGGGAGQVLAKSSTTDYATTWVDGTALPASQVKQLVKNMTGSAIPKGSVVYYSGADGTHILISLSDADTEATSSKTVGFTESDIANAGTGYVVSEGLISNVDTGSATAGQSVWLSSTAGGYVFGAPPAKPAHSVYLGLVTRANANTGEIFVKVQNGFELNELHDVNINSGTVVNGQALTYSNGQWVNSTPVNALSGLSDVALSGPTTGQVLKYNGTAWANATGGSGGVTAQATAPSLSTASNGDAWFNTTDGTMYVCFVDADSTKQWVQVQANSALDASIQGRVGALESQAIALGTYSPNYIINGAFDINQRNFSSATSYGYNFDRWYHSSSGGTATCSAQTFTPGTIVTNIGDAANYVRMITSGQSGATDYAGIQQRIEDVRTLAGQTVTISFWARAASGTPKVGFTFEQSFGSGGTPSSNVITSIGSVTISSSWARYSYTTTVPSIAGKTIGTTANSSSLALELWTSMGSGLTAYSNIGVQNTQIDFWGIQLERGSTATSFRRNGENIQAELAACQRYYFRRGPGNNTAESMHVIGNASTSTGGFVTIQFPVEMRTIPSSVEFSAVAWNVWGVSTGSLTSMSFLGGYSGKQSGLLQIGGTGFPASGTVLSINTTSNTGYIGVNAEL